MSNSYVDSLKHELSIATNADDSTRLLCRISMGSKKLKKENSNFYGRLALEVSKRATTAHLKAMAYDAAARTYVYDGDKDHARFLYNKSLQIAIDSNLLRRIGWCYYHLASIEISDNNFRLAGELATKSHKYFSKSDRPGLALNSYWMLFNASKQEYVDTLILKITEQCDTIKNENDLLFKYLSLSNLHTKKENRKEAMHYVQKAIVIADKNQNNTGIVKAYTQIAEYFKNYQKNYEVALIYYEKILDIKLKNDMWGHGDTYLALGEIQNLLNNDSLAIANFNLALDYGISKNYKHSIASAYRQLGNYHFQNKNYEDALYNYQKCYKTGCNTCPQIKFHDALVRMGDIYLQSKEFEKSLNLYNKSLVLADSSFDDRARVKSYGALAAFYSKRRKTTKSVEMYQKAYDIAYEADFLEGQHINAQQLSVLYKLKNNYQKAFHYLNITNQLSDSIQKLSEADNLATLETLLDFKNLQIQQQAEATIAEKEISRQKLLRNFFVVGFLLMVVSGVLIYRSYKRKKKDNIALQEQKQAIEEMSKKVHEADKAKLHFYTNVSHELRTPLTLILGMTEKLKESLNANQHLQTIRKNSLKLLQLINHLLDLRKLDESKMILRVSKGNICEYITGVISSFEDYAKQKKIQLSCKCKIVDKEGFFDKDKLEKILSNLLSNAIKYTSENGKIEILVNENETDIVTVDVIDNGVGISPEDIKQVFNRFYRVEGSSSQGSGIGLALVKELVEIHKGEIKVESDEKSGSKFSVSIPIGRRFYSKKEIVDSEDDVSSLNFIELLDNEQKQPTKNDSNPDPDNKSVLIVEDNADLRQFIADIFRKSFQVIEAENGEQGFELTQKFIPDIIISDVIMPKVTGIQLVELIKNNATTSHIPVILLTAKNDLGTRISGFEKGADDYISKPFESIILKSRVENLLRMRNQLVEKFSKQFHLQPREIHIEDNEQKFLEKAINVIENHISDPNLNIDLLAMELCVSRTQLYRKLKALTDYSANQFIRIIRLKRAAQILKHGQNNIAEVMDATGFSNYSHFNNCFKEYFGEYPKDYALLSVKGSLN